MSTVYIAGPMRGIKYYNFDAFFNAEAMLHGRGCSVVNPARMDLDAGFNPYHLRPNYDWNIVPDNGFDFKKCLDRDIDAVRNADIIYMLQGWQNSQGAVAEKALAEWCGLEVWYEVTEQQRGLPEDSAERKKYPMYSGLIKYFPDALAEVAHHSWEGNEKHNPGQPLHWAREKSSDQEDALVRHITEGNWTGVAWRALAKLQLECEQHTGNPG